MPEEKDFFTENATLIFGWIGGVGWALLTFASALSPSPTELAKDCFRISSYCGVVVLIIASVLAVFKKNPQWSLLAAVVFLGSGIGMALGYESRLEAFLLASLSIIGLSLFASWLGEQVAKLAKRNKKVWRKKKQPKKKNKGGAKGRKLDELHPKTSVPRGVLLDREEKIRKSQ